MADSAGGRPHRLPDPVVLSRGNVRLEPLTLEHVQGLHNALCDPEVWRWLQYPQPVDETATGLLVVKALEQQEAGLRRPFATCVDGAVIGTTSFWDSDVFSSGIEIGATFIGKPWWRTHVNTTAKFLMLEHAFEVCHCIRVELKTDALNQKSRNAILRIGAKEEGTLRQHLITSTGRVRDSVYFSILESEWPEVKHRLQARLERR